MATPPLSPPRRQRRLRALDRVFPGVFVIGLGVWFLLRNLGLSLPNFIAFWPLILVAGGLWSIIAWFVDRDRFPDGGRLWLGLMGTFTGIVLLAFSLGAEITSFIWAERRGVGSLLSIVWPAFPIAAGVAWLIQYVAEGLRRPGLLIPAIGALTMGFISYGIALGMVTTAVWPIVWPVALILGGALLLVAALRGR